MMAWTLRYSGSTYPAGACDGDPDYGTGPGEPATIAPGVNS